MGLLTSLPKLPLVGSILLVLCSLFTPATAYTELGDEALRAIPSGGDSFGIHTGSLLAPILIPRVPGTPGSAKVQQHFVDFFRAHLPEWTIEWHNSTSKTPATGDKDIPFTNLIFRRDPPWTKDGEVERLTLVAHYDSLVHPDGFIGAIDSAAPCAMLLHAARSIEDALVKKWKAMEASGDAGSGLEEEKGIQIILLDGEEAWVSWTDTDSLYGARYVVILSVAVEPSNMSQSSCPKLGVRSTPQLDLQDRTFVHQPLPPHRLAGRPKPANPLIFCFYPLGVQENGQD